MGFENCRPNFCVDSESAKKNFWIGLNGARGRGGENFVSRFLKIVALIFRVDSESAKKVF